MESQGELIGLAAIVVAGIGAQWLAWRVKFPAILLLLLGGFLVGPVAGLVKPDEMLGDLLFPMVSLAVGIILFEGGLSLHLPELQQIGKPLWRLIIFGVLVTWGVTTLAAQFLMGLPLQMALLLGAILVVTGPTVIIPLLRQVRPGGQVEPILKWEGILIDPVGAVLALLVFESIIAGEAKQSTTMTIVGGMLATVLYGGLLGIIGALVLTQMLRRYWIPDFLQNPVTIMMVVAVFAASNYLQHESGLLAVTVMGIIMANQRSAIISHIVEFKENIRVLLISGLFIVLAARLSVEDFRNLPLASLAFLAVLVIVVRPLAVFVSTAGTKLTTNQKLFLSWMAPRGIVAASVASVFSLRLIEGGYTDATMLAPVTFLVIVGTVTLYGLTAAPAARILGVAQENPTGVLIVGAHRWARAIAQELKAAGVRVLMADTNWAYVSTARMEGLRAYFGNVLSEHAEDKMDLSGIGKLIAMTPNDQVNALAAVHFAEFFDRKNVYQLPSESDQVSGRNLVSERLRGRDLFNSELTYRRITRLFMEDAALKKTPLTEEFTYANFREHYGEHAYPLMLLDPDAGPIMMTVVDPPKPKAGQHLLSLILPMEESVVREPEEAAAP